METNTLKFSSLKRKEFREVLKRGKNLKEGFLVLKWKKNKEKKIRFGVLMSTKFSKKAVLRNKAKRRIKEIVRANLKNFLQGYDLIFIPLRGLKTDFETLKKKINKFFKKTKILKK